MSSGLPRSSLASLFLMQLAESGRMGKHALTDVARSHAALALAMTGSVDAAATLLKLIDGDGVREHSRRSAAIAIGLAGAHEGADLIALRVADPKLSDSVRGPACQALGLLGGTDPAHEKALLLALNDKSDEVAQHAALSHLGGPEAVEPLLELLESSAKKRNTRISAATALGLILARRERDLLFELDAHTNPWGLTQASRELAVGF